MYVDIYCVGVQVFVFKQKTAYEMRSIYWSSDVCSSDLTELPYLNTLARYSFVIASSVYTSCIYIPTHPQAAGGGTGPLPRSTMPATDSAAGPRNGEDRISETDAAFGRQSAYRHGRRRRVRDGLSRRHTGLERTDERRGGNK